MTDESKSSNDFPEEILLRIREQDVRMGDILAEVRHFTAVSGILFGFLPTVSVAYTAQVPGIVPRVLLLLALVCTGSATLIFILPPLYHHLRFPMDQKQTLQFFWRSHKFILWGIVPLYAGVYFSVFLALYNVIGASAAAIATGMVIIPFCRIRIEKNRRSKGAGIDPKKSSMRPQSCWLSSNFFSYNAIRVGYA